MALPMALTEDVWDLGETLSLGRTLTVLALSIFVLAGFIWGLFYSQRVVKYKGPFLKRVVSAYLVTFGVSLLLLFLFDEVPLDDLKVTLKRTNLRVFPPSFTATTVDFI